LFENHEGNFICTPFASLESLDLYKTLFPADSSSYQHIIVFFNRLFKLYVTPEPFSGLLLQQND